MNIFTAVIFAKHKEYGKYCYLYTYITHIYNQIRKL